MIPEVYKPDFVHVDERGDIISFDDTEPGINFVKTNLTTSRRDVIRGFHCSKFAKMFSCVYGTVFLVAVYCRHDDLFGSLWTYELSDKNHLRVLVPADYGVGTLTLSDMSIVEYRWEQPYDGKAQRSFRWDAFGRDIWPVENPIVSERDRLGRFVD